MSLGTTQFKLTLDFTQLSLELKLLWKQYRYWQTLIKSKIKFPVVCHVLRFFFRFSDSVLGFMILFSILRFCFGFCDFVLFLSATVVFCKKYHIFSMHRRGSLSYFDLNWLVCTFKCYQNKGVSQSLSSNRRPLSSKSDNIGNSFLGSEEIIIIQWNLLLMNLYVTKSFSREKSSHSKIYEKRTLI